jgi:hypothetical protein
MNIFEQIEILEERQRIADYNFFIDTNIKVNDIIKLKIFIFIGNKKSAKRHTEVRFCGVHDTVNGKANMLKVQPKSFKVGNNNHWLIDVDIIDYITKL